MTLYTTIDVGVSSVMWMWYITQYRNKFNTIFFWNNFLLPCLTKFIYLLSTSSMYKWHSGFVSYVFYIGRSEFTVIVITMHYITPERQAISFWHPCMAIKVLHSHCMAPLQVYLHNQWNTADRNICMHSHMQPHTPSFPHFSPSTVLCMQPPSGKVWGIEPLILPCDIRHLAAQGEKTWVGH